LHILAAVILPALAMPKSFTPGRWLAGGLAGASEINPCDLLEVTGWGRTSETGGKPAPEALQKGEVPNTGNGRNACNGAIKAGMICAGFRAGGR
jgi:hypothetical protein